MRQHSISKNRKKLETKIAAAFQDQIKSLPTEYQKMLVDDMVTAFENRLIVLNRVLTGPQLTVGAIETVQLQQV